MKKLFLAVVIIFSIVSCNDGGNTGEPERTKAVRNEATHVEVKDTVKIKEVIKK